MAEDLDVLASESMKKLVPGGRARSGDESLSSQQVTGALHHAREIIDSQRLLKKESKAANFLVDCLARAQSQLAAAIKEGLRPDSNKGGAQKQIDQIKDQLGRIEAWLGKNAKH